MGMFPLMNMNRRETDCTSSCVVMCGNASRWERLVQKYRCTVGSLGKFCNMVKPLCTPEDQRQNMVIFIITHWEKKRKRGKMNWCLNGIDEVSDFNFYKEDYWLLFPFIALMSAFLIYSHYHKCLKSLWYTSQLSS